MVKRLAIRLGVPVFPDSTLTFTGSVTATSAAAAAGIVEVAFGPAMTWASMSPARLRSACER